VNHCTNPGCEATTVEVTLPLVVTVLDTDTVSQVGLPLYIFDETTTLIYTHVLNRGGMGVRSPLDSA
jgi:hypothetical protein